jgi:hypothetical protein
VSWAALLGMGTDRLPPCPTINLPVTTGSAGNSRELFDCSARSQVGSAFIPFYRPRLAHLDSEPQKSPRHIKKTYLGDFRRPTGYLRGRQAAYPDHCASFSARSCNLCPMFFNVMSGGVYLSRPISFLTAFVKMFKTALICPGPSFIPVGRAEVIC